MRESDRALSIRNKTERKFKGKSLLFLPDDYTVIDIETTGLSSRACEIIEVSALRVRNETIVANFSTLVRPVGKIDFFISQLTGITNDMVKDAPNINYVMQKFYEFAGKDLLIGHNVNFDINFLYDNLLLHNGLVLDNSFIDTLRLSRKVLPSLPNHKQITIAEHYGIATTGSHRAMKDCEICNLCYLNLKREARQQNLLLYDM